MSGHADRHGQQLVAQLGKALTPPSGPSSIRVGPAPGAEGKLALRRLDHPLRRR